MEKKYSVGLVSVIMPIYNAEAYLSDALNSIFAQDYKLIEIVLVDDCSNDNSAKLILEYKKKTSRNYLSSSGKEYGCWCSSK